MKKTDKIICNGSPIDTIIEIGKTAIEAILKIAEEVVDDGPDEEID